MPRTLGPEAVREDTLTRPAAPRRRGRHRRSRRALVLDRRPRPPEASRSTRSMPGRCSSLSTGSDRRRSPRCWRRSAAAGRCSRRPRDRPVRGAWRRRSRAAGGAWTSRSGAPSPMRPCRRRSPSRACGRSGSRFSPSSPPTTPAGSGSWTCRRRCCSSRARSRLSIRRSRSPSSAPGGPPNAGGGSPARSAVRSRLPVRSSCRASRSA